MNSYDKKIVILGSGQLGTFYADYFGKQGYKIVQPKLDIRNYDEVAKVVSEAKPEFLVNVAAKTNIDWCEQNKLECFDINTLGADNVAKVCQENNVYLIHVSSGCVQESKSAAEEHKEEDIPDPLCFYSWTKVWAENMVMDRAKKHGLKALILRPRQLLSSMVSPRNALTKMLTYTKFIDTDNSCTIVEDLMYATDELIKKNAVGVYNVTNPGITSPYKTALLLKQIIKPDMQIEKISKDELNRMTLAKRIDSVLNTDKLKGQGIMLKDISERLVDIITQLKHNLEQEDSKKVMAQTEAETIQKLSLVK